MGVRATVRAAVVLAAVLVPAARAAFDVERAAAELSELTRVPSVSSLPEHAADVRAAAEWVARRCERAGASSAAVLDTPGPHPNVVCEFAEAEPAAPTVLLYAHFDVQPADPLEAWHGEAFSGRVERDEETGLPAVVHGRGASDDKAGLVGALFGVEAARTANGGTLPARVVLLAEGQEEIGSPGLDAFVQAHASKLRADAAFSNDGSMPSRDRAALVVGYRGGTALEVVVTGPSRDLHSGVYGGSVANPLHALSQIVAGLHDANGTVTVPGFYDGVRGLGPEERAELANPPLDDAVEAVELGVPEMFGEPGFTTVERRGARPTLEVVGMGGGFQGEGVKTVLPSQARAKIVCRLVPGQDPDEIAELVASHVAATAPPGVTVETPRLTFRATPWLATPDSLAMRVARDVLTDMHGGVPPSVRREGGSIPAVAIVSERLGLDMATLAFGVPENRVHSPDEFVHMWTVERTADAVASAVAAVAARRQRKESSHHRGEL